jgi:recombinase
MHAPDEGLRSGRMPLIRWGSHDSMCGSRPGRRPVKLRDAVAASGPRCQPRPRSRAASWADARRTRTESPTPARTPTRPRPPGRRLHRLEPDPVSAPIVARIFTQYLAGRGMFSIAEALTRDRVASPSAHDPEGNRHRSGAAWSKAAVRVILTNPRYTGRQIWNKRRKDEVLIDVDDVGLGHETRMRWNPPDKWVWSAERVHEPLVDTDTFERAQQVLGAHGKDRSTRESHHRARHP